MLIALTSDNDDTLLRIKAVPGAGRDQISGLLGDRLKMHVVAPPQGGKAKKAICQLLSETTGHRVTLESGHATAMKRCRVHG